MIREAGIDIASLPEEDFDDPLGKSTGAATIFAATGGVMEAALRTVYEIVEQKPLLDIEFTPLRGLEGIKEASVTLGGKEVRVAAAHTLKNARILLDEIKAGTSPYAFIEIMTCPGGCVGGGGQPLLPTDSTAPCPWQGHLHRGQEAALAQVPRESRDHGHLQGLPGVNPWATPRMSSSIRTTRRGPSRQEEG